MTLMYMRGQFLSTLALVRWDHTKKMFMHLYNLNFILFQGMMIMRKKENLSF